MVDIRNGVRTSLYGGGTADELGWSMAFGDVDGDGFTDFLCSSAKSQGPDNRYDYGSDAYLVFGRPRAEIDSIYPVELPGGADIVFYNAGFTMTCADLNNDGYDDVILARNGIYVIFGAPRAELKRVYDFNLEYPDHTPNPDYTQPDIHVVGSQFLGGADLHFPGGGAHFVQRSLVSGDINGDGFADIVFGNYILDYQSGAVYIVFGRPRGQFPPVIDVDYSSQLPHPDVVILGDSNEHYATSLAIGDLDGDRVDDLLVNTSWGWGENNTRPSLGEINGWWGKRTWKSEYDTQVDDFDFALQGSPGPNDMYGYQAGTRMATGDLDGDGRDDLIIGSYDGYRAQLPSDRSGMGEYRVLFGRPRALWPKWGNAVDMTDVLILGAETLDAFSDTSTLWGYCFSLATGNRDGDAYDDLLIGAGMVRRPDDGARSGGAYWLRGRPRSEWEPLIDLRDGYDMIIRGADGCDGSGNCGGTGGRAYDLFGFMTAMGDLDGNGKDELFIAAPFADGPNNSCFECGEISVIYDDDASATAESTRPPFAPSALLSNFPNPFNSSTTFRVVASPGKEISLTVYDALGREVARPIETTRMVGNERDIRWNAIDQEGRALPSGVYFVKLQAGNVSHAKKVLLVR